MKWLHTGVDTLLSLTLLIIKSYDLSGTGQPTVIDFQRGYTEQEKRKLAAFPPKACFN